MLLVNKRGESVSAPPNPKCFKEENVRAMACLLFLCYLHLICFLTSHIIQDIQRYPFSINPYKDHYYNHLSFITMCFS